MLTYYPNIAVSDSTGSDSTGCCDSTVLYSNDIPVELEVGGIPIGQTFIDKSMQEMQDMLLYPEQNPSLTNPSNSFSMSPSGYREIGEVLFNISFSAGFNRGSINPAYGTDGYRSGLPNTYLYSGVGLPTSISSTSLSNSQSTSFYIVQIGTQSQSGRVSYDGGDQPLTNKGNDYLTPLPAGTTGFVTRYIYGVYPVFATTVDISVLTKQTLRSMSSTYIQINVVIEQNPNKQTVDFPEAQRTITGIQYYSTVSGSQEQINGSKANSLSTFTIESTTHVIQGNVINYIRYVHNGSLTGFRQLRQYTT